MRTTTAHSLTPQPQDEGALVAQAPQEALWALELRVYWGDILLSVDHLTQPKAVLIGETKNCDVFLCSDDLPSVEFPLIRFVDGEYVLTFFEHLAGELSVGTRVLALQDVPGAIDDDVLSDCRCIVLQSHVRALVHFAGLTLAMQFVTPPVRIEESLEVDFQFLNILVIAFFVLVAGLVSLNFYPYDIEQLSEVMLNLNSPMSRIIIEPPKPELVRKGKEPVKDKPKPSNSRGSNGPVRIATPTGDRSDKEIVHDIAILRVLDHPFASLSTVLGPGARINEEVVSALSDLRSARPGGSDLGVRFTGTNGPGNSLAIGHDIETQGRRPGDINFGNDVGRIGPKQQVDIRIADEPPVVHGALDPALIRAVIRDNRNAIRFCYERQLQIDKTLSGTIRVQFVIAADGTVSMAMVKETTMRNAEVESCIVQKIRSFVFPKPAGGGIVIVNYPFSFRPI